MSPSICFVAPKAYGLLTGDPAHRHVGGAEVQQVFLAKGLTRRGYQVKFITLDYGQEDGAKVDGISLYKAYKPAVGLPLLRVFHPKWTSLAAAMARADADIYYQRTCGIESGQVCMWCKPHGRRFVFSIGSDADCDISCLKTLPLALERWLYRYGVRHADAIVAQTQSQQRLLRENFGLESAVVPSCRVLPENAALSQPSAPGRILWVGRFTEVKRPNMCLDLAQRCPQLHFDIVGDSNKDSDFARQFTDRARTLPNVTLHGYVAHERMDEYYQAATALLCTSSYEGFPNTFLEAFSHGRPVVTTFDPDGVVAANQMGRVAANLEGLLAALKELVNGPAFWEGMARRAREYVAKNHSVDTAVTAYEAIFARVMQEGGRHNG